VESLEKEMAYRSEDFLEELTSIRQDLSEDLRGIIERAEKLKRRR
jgi:hypothetical protein